MARRCDICGKKRVIGKSGAHKYGGKWAMRAQEKTRIWRPNLQNFTLDGRKMKLCAKCIKRIKFDLKKRVIKTEKSVGFKSVTEEKKPKEKKVIKKVAKKSSK